MFRRVALVALFVAAGCGPGVDPMPIAEDCQPLMAGADCLLPYPSDFFRAKDESQPSGAKIVIGKSARMTLKDGTSADIHSWRPADGFSRVPAIVAMFPHAVAATGLVGILDDPTASTEATSPTLIIDAETHERIPHFVDLDPRAKEPTKQAIVLHPLVMLRERARYVVVIHGLKDPDGVLIDTPEGFRRLRDDQYSADKTLNEMSERYKKWVFPAIEKAGLSKKDVQLAWDFTTRSDANVTNDLFRVRELTLAWLSSNTPTIEIKEVIENPSPGAWRLIRGKVTGPLFLKEAGPGGRLFTGDDGQVAQNGETQFDFSLLLPENIKEKTTPSRAIAYGHGFFGTLQNVEASVDIASQLQAGLYGVEWWGMSTPDVVKVADALTSKPSQALAFTDRLHQAMANWLVMTAAMRGPMQSVSALRHADNLPVLEASPRHYIGISQGHILGGTLAALNPDFDRIVLHVGGAGFTEFMMRARPFSSFLFLLETGISEPLDQQKFLATTQVYFDRIDPATYAQYVLANPLPGMPTNRRVLMQAGLGDVEVPNIGTFLHARLLGLPLLQPAPASVFGLEPVQGPVDGSALSLYDFGIDVKAAYTKAQPAEDENHVHDYLRFEDAVLRQLDQFYREDSRIIQPCSGICDPN